MEPAELVEPAGQGEQLSPLENVLGGQGEHEFSLDAGTEPPGQTEQVLEPALEIVPAGQSEQDVAPAWEYHPAGQGEHLPPDKYWPACLKRYQYHCQYLDVKIRLTRQELEH